jgi:hypothetical protein
MKNITRAALALTILASGAAGAAETYVGLQLIRSESSCQGFRDGVAPLGLTASCKENDNGYRISGGMYLTEIFGIEAGYQDAGEGKADAAANGVYALTLTAPLKAFDLLGTARFKLDNDISLVGRIGFARWDYEVKSNVGGFGASKKDTTLTYGVGAEWKWLTVGYDVIRDVGQGNTLNASAPDIKQDVKRWSIGLKYQF